jgi:hypothetical protein
MQSGYTYAEFMNVISQREHRAWSQTTLHKVEQMLYSAKKMENNNYQV